MSLTELNGICLFIGGPADGQRIGVPVQQNRFQYRAGDKLHDYHAQVLAGEGAPLIRVFIREGMSTGEALWLLIARYRESPTRHR